MSKAITTGLLVLVVLALTATATTAKESQKKITGYQNIEVVRFQVDKDVELPADYLVSMTEELIEQIGKTKRFKLVLREGEALTEADSATIQLSGRVTKFSAGSRAKRYFIGFGVGKTKVVAHIKLIDRATGKVLFEKDVDGEVTGGMFGGESRNATRGLAKDVAKVVKKQF
jgi:hypothetical protein